MEHFGVEPDIVCAAKGIASGVPLGAMIARQRIMNWPKGAHGNTYGGNPLACAAALATIDLIEESTWKMPLRTGDYTLESAQQPGRTPSFHRPGARSGVDDWYRVCQEPDTHEPDEALRDRVVDLAFERGLLLLGLR